VLASQAAANFGLAVLAPVLRDHYDLSLTQVGLLLGGSSVGALLTLLRWGLAADRIGERTTATIGLAGAAGALAAAAYARGFAALLAFLFLMAAFAASTNTATGRAGDELVRPARARVRPRRPADRDPTRRIRCGLRRFRGRRPLGPAGLPSRPRRAPARCRGRGGRLHGRGAGR
jgi:MFS family permease